MAVIGVVVVDVHVAFTDAFAALLSTSADLRVVGAAFDTASAVAAVRRLHPDVATVDLDLAGTDGVDVVAAVHALAPDLAITIVTGVKNPQRAITAIWSGATSWVAKEDSTTTLFDVLRRAAAGESSFPPALLGQILRTLVASGDSRSLRTGALSTLSQRESDVLLCLVEGLDRRATAERLHLSVNTVRTHIQNIFEKLGAHSTLEAVALAVSAGARRHCGHTEASTDRPRPGCHGLRKGHAAGAQGDC